MIVLPRDIDYSDTLDALKLSEPHQAALKAARCDTVGHLFHAFDDGSLAKKVGSDIVQAVANRFTVMGWKFTRRSGSWGRRSGEAAVTETLSLAKPITKRDPVDRLSLPEPVLDELKRLGLRTIQAAREALRTGFIPRGTMVSGHCICTVLDRRLVAIGENRV